MIYPYPVKHNGVWYPAWTEVPAGEDKKPDKPTEPQAEESELTEQRHVGKRGRPKR